MANALMGRLALFLFSSSILICMSSRPKSQEDNQVLEQRETLDIIDSLGHLCDDPDAHGVSAVIHKSHREHKCQPSHCDLVRDCLQCLREKEEQQSNCSGAENALRKVLTEEIEGMGTSSKSVFLWTGDFANSKRARGHDFITLESFQVSACVMRTMEELSDPSTKFVPPELWKLYVPIWDFLSTSFVQHTLMVPVKMHQLNPKDVAQVGIFLDAWKHQSTIDCQEIPSVAQELGRVAEERATRGLAPIDLIVKLINKNHSGTCSYRLGKSCTAARIRWCIFSFLNVTLENGIHDDHCCKAGSRFVDSHTCRHLGTPYASPATCHFAEGWGNKGIGYGYREKLVTDYARRNGTPWARGHQSAKPYQKNLSPKALATWT